METGIIYCCHNIQNGKKYIGQTRRNLQERIEQHIRDSKKSSYRKFYRGAIKHGWDNFIWGIVEECNHSILSVREQYWIEHFDTYNFGYNSTLGGEGRIDPNRCMNFTLMSPEGDIVEEKNLRKFCRKNNLDFGSLQKVLSGKSKSCKGWKLPQTEKIGIDCSIKEFTIMSPEGDIIKGKNVAEFCRENNLHSGEISKVLSGKAKSHKEWKLPETKLIGRQSTSETKSKYFQLISPDGILYKDKNIFKFCVENNLSHSCISRVLSGKQKHHKGWKIAT